MYGIHIPSLVPSPPLYPLSFSPSLSAPSLAPLSRPLFSLVLFPLFPFPLSLTLFLPLSFYIYRPIDVSLVPSLSVSPLSFSSLSPLSFSTHSCASPPSPCLSLLTHSLLFPFPPASPSLVLSVSLPGSISLLLSFTYTHQFACMHEQIRTAHARPSSDLFRSSCNIRVEAALGAVLIIATLYGPSRGSWPIRAFRLWCVLVYVSGPCQPDDSFCLPVALRVIGQIQWNSNSEVEIYHSNSEVEIYHSSLDQNWNEGSKVEQQGWNHSSLDWNNYWSLSAAYDPQRCLCDRSAPIRPTSAVSVPRTYPRPSLVEWYYTPHV